MINFLIVIPVYNHAKTLREVVLRALSVHREVLVVDDGSTDGGFESIADLDIRVIRHSRNKGKGAAILSAAREARRLGMTHIITLDADGQHNPDDIVKFLPAIEKNPLSIVIGRRNFDTQTVPGLSRFGRSFSNFWLRVQTGQKISDVQSGFRAYPVSVLEKLKFYESRYAFEVEVLVRAAWAGIELQEVDVAVYYPPKEKRVSHFRVFRDNLEISLLNTRLTFRAMLPWPHRKLVCTASGKLEFLSFFQQLKGLLLNKSTPVNLALSSALGIFLGTLPLIGCHSILIVLVANYLRLNKLMALGASQLCMPPIVPALCIEAGYFLRHGKFLTEVSLQTLGYECVERVFEWFLGSLFLAPAFAALISMITYLTVILLRKKVNVDGQIMQCSE